MQPVAVQVVAGKAWLGLAASSFLTGLGFAAAPGTIPSESAATAGPGPAAVGAGPAASLETQKQGRVWAFSIPAPRGQICDRNGLPLALQRVGYNLGLSFPRPLNFSGE